MSSERVPSSGLYYSVIIQRNVVLLYTKIVVIYVLYMCNTLIVMQTTNDESHESTAKRL